MFMTYPDMMKMRENYCENAVNILVIIGLFYLITILILVLGVGILNPSLTDELIKVMSITGLGLIVPVIFSGIRMALYLTDEMKKFQKKMKKISIQFKTKSISLTNKVNH